MGGQVVAATTINPEDANYQTAITAGKGSNPQAVYYGGEFPQAGPLSQQMKSAGLNVPVMGGDGIYDPGYINSVVVLTDGKNEDPSSLTEQQLVANLTRASKDTGRPVRIALIGISQDADLAALQRIAKAVPDGHAYDARQPENIYPIMQEILTTRGLVAPAQ